MLKAYKYRIYPTEEQKFLMNKTFGCTRYVYNTCLYLRKWLREPDCQALNATILNMDKAYPHFFNHAVNHSYGFPKYKKRGGHQSFQCPGNTWEVNWEQSTLTIPKIADIPIVLSRPFEGKIKTVTISMTPTGKYFASILVDNERKLPGKPRVDENLTLGIDLGLKDFAITSSGLKIPAPRLLRQKIDRLNVLQRRASHHRKGSGKRRKTNLRLAVMYERMTNQRNHYLDFLHQLPPTWYVKTKPPPWSWRILL